MAVGVQVPPSAPSIKGAMTLSYCSLYLFCPYKNPISTISVYFWYRNVSFPRVHTRKLVRAGIIIARSLMRNSL